MKAQNRIRTWLTLLALTMLIARSVSGGETPPDLIKGETKGVDRQQTYNLGVRDFAGGSTASR